ncbi:MAG TPA: hypothetical protein VHU83_22525 [Bryobacteraceae bacterium]|jgi:hypothetical protein|nr:hypothetical protein [Bryobacteraceae bacterium]
MARSGFLLFPATLLALCLPLSASTVGLADWCFNLDGNWNSLAGACNGGGNIFGPGSTFDTTLEPGTNNLGSAKFWLGVGQYAVAYMDYDLDFQTYGSFQDFGATPGALPPGLTWEMADPNTSNIFNDFASNSLTDTNSVGIAGGPPNPCCDVAWAIGLRNPLAIPVTVTFTVSGTAPSTGFYLQQKNLDVGDSIYLSETFTPVPEPSAAALLLFALAALAFPALILRMPISCYPAYRWTRRSSPPTICACSPSAITSRPASPASTP